MSRTVFVTGEKYEDDNGRAERFMKLVERYTDFEEITPVMIREFIEKIVVQERDMPMVQSSPQKAEGYYDKQKAEPPKKKKQRDFTTIIPVIITQSGS
ncbi:MAG: DUF4368 domain-containing protein [Oscillospiraceae bacterium]|nr:DUF4368 domain-containing protein [Oscillospiraceae bacterium]